MVRRRHDVSQATATERITRNPAILGGQPIVRGTRVPVYLIVDWVNSGHTPEEIVADYPDLTVEDLEAALAYAAAERERTDGHSGKGAPVPTMPLDANRPPRAV